MKSRASDKPIPQRLATNEIVRLGGFSPWWVRCPECDKLATLDPGYGKRVSECKCISCGAIYRIQINPNYVRQILGLPLWFKETFRREVFWAVNGDHLLYLEK